MTKKILYQGQILDPSGYAVAGRGYIKSIVDYIESIDADIDFKLVAISADQQSTLTEEEQELVSKYQFTSEKELKDWIEEGDYHYGEKTGEWKTEYDKEKLDFDIDDTYSDPHNLGRKLSRLE